MAMTSHTHIHTQQVIRHAVFLGSKSLGLNILKSLYSHSSNIKWTIIHPNDSDDTRSNLIDFQNFARLCDLDILISSSSAATKQILSDFKFDIGFVCGWYSLLDSEALSFVPNGLWGIHNSLLPKYRGGSPLVWSIMNGDAFVGSSVFKLTEGMDTGDILLQVEVENKITDDIQSLLNKIENKLLTELPNKWISLINGEAHLYTQMEDNATYCGQRTEEDGLIKWDKPAAEIHNFIKAQSPPYPCAYSFLLDKKILFLKSIPSALIYDGTPGQILRRTNTSVLVSCGNRTALEILEISANGKPSIPTTFIRSIKQRFRNEALLSLPS
jgi:methionyl-tRNA formyltransferase